MLCVLFLTLFLLGGVVLGAWSERRRASWATRVVLISVPVCALLLAALQLDGAALGVGATAGAASFAFGRTLVCIGLTGGVATGKSSVSRLLAQTHGFTIVDADEVAKSVRARGSWGYRNIVSAFGSGVLGSDGEIDKAELRRRIFGDANRAARRKLNSALALPLGVALLRAMLSARLRHGRAVVVDAPTLFETGLDKLCWPVLAVHCDAAEQLRRLQARGAAGDGSAAPLSADDAAAQIASQMPVALKCDLAHLVVDNSSAPDALPGRVEDVVRALRGMLK